MDILLSETRAECATGSVNWGPENVPAFNTFQPGHSQASTVIVVETNFSSQFTSFLQVQIPPSPPPSSELIFLQVHLLPPSSPLFKFTAFQVHLLPPSSAFSKFNSLQVHLPLRSAIRQWSGERCGEIRNLEGCTLL